MSAPTNHGPEPFDRDDALRARLRAGDPAADLQAVDPAVLSRLVSTSSTGANDAAEPGGPGGPGAARSRLALLVAAAAVVAVAGGGLWSLTGPPTDEPSSSSVAIDPPTTLRTPVPPGREDATVLGVPDVGATKCMVPNVEVLARQDLAFAGTVTAVAGAVVTLRTDRVYAGEVSEVVDVIAPSPELGRLLGAVQFEVARTYLVSASGGQVSLCGLSAETNPGLAALYDEAYAG